MLRKAKGNMYAFVDYTWNPIKGRCPHDCIYCYMKRWPLKEPRLDESKLKRSLVNPKTGKEDMFIFVGSSIDLFAEGIPSLWLFKVLEKTRAHPGNTYLFQTRNTERMYDFYIQREFPPNVVYGTTIESDFSMDGTRKAPYPVEREHYLAKIEGRRMVTIEPIMDFDYLQLVYLISMIEPEWVNIGADSGGNRLPEPSPEKIGRLVEKLRGITTVNLKPNLRRIYKE